MKIKKDKLQGLLVRGYGKLPAAAYVQLRVGEAAAGRAYLRDLLTRITPGDRSPEDVAVQVAFTWTGLRALELPATALAGFSREFREGMTEPHRRFVLGDVGCNAPEHWAWGNDAHPVDMLLMLFAVDRDTLSEVYAREKAAWNAAGLTEVHALESDLLPDGKEHFGFRDGISQPVIDGLYGQATSAEKQALGNPHVPAGEFMLGYPNAYAQYPDSPTLKRKEDQNDLLPVSAENAESKDFGKDGSYLVVRQLRQDVPAFWRYMRESTREPAADGTHCPVTLAAKMVGRWPNGTSLVQSPDRPVAEAEITNEFGYWEDDFRGMKCPAGAHVRRTNPRDWLLTEKTRTDAREMVDKHKLLRRGRPYGPPLRPSLDVAELQRAEPDGEERGLLFICCVGDIVRQFEFVQNNWVRFTKFGGGYQENDPLLGPHRPDHALPEDDFVVPARPARRRYRRLPAFTELVGGAYYFLPGMAALRYLSHP